VPFCQQQVANCCCSLSFSEASCLPGCSLTTDESSRARYECLQSRSKPRCVAADELAGPSPGAARVHECGLGPASARAVFRSAAGRLLPTPWRPRCSSAAENLPPNVSRHTIRSCALGLLCFSHHSLTKIDGFWGEEAEMTNSHASAVFCSVI